MAKRAGTKRAETEPATSEPGLSGGPEAPQPAGRTGRLSSGGASRGAAASAERAEAAERATGDASGGGGLFQPSFFGGMDDAPAPAPTSSSVPKANTDRESAVGEADKAPAVRGPAAAGRARGQRSAKAGGVRDVEFERDEPEVGREPFVPLSRIAGQRRAIDVLRRALASQRVHHAWIFGGPSGVGKRSAAVGFAARLLEAGDGADASRDDVEQGPAHGLIAAGAHPGLHVITKELAAVSSDRAVRDGKQRTIAVEVVREFVIGPAQRTVMPAAGADGRPALASKVFVIDEAELMGHSAQNALLKTLEEPSPGTVLVLVTSAEEQLLATIRSRCQRVRFGALDESSLRAWLGSSHGALPQAEADAALRFAQGRPGLAELALRTGLTSWPAKLAPIAEQVVGGRYPLGAGATIGAMVDAWAKAWVDEREQASKSAANLAAFEHAVRLLGTALGSRLGSADIGQQEQIACAIEALAEAERMVRSNVQIPLAMDWWAATASAVRVG